MLSVKGLHVSVGETEILNGISLEVPTGETHVIMGPNGSGKSTLAHALVGTPGYEVTTGETWLNDTELLALEPEERANAGLALAYQNPPAVPGVAVHQLLRLARKNRDAARGTSPLPLGAFLKELRTALSLVGLAPETLERAVHEGMSGGERKRLELAQLMVLKPECIILDEIDSGLDVDGLRLVGEAVGEMRRENPSLRVLVITHYDRLLDVLPPDKVHVLRQGVLVRSGDASLAREIQQHGYR